MTAPITPQCLHGGEGTSGGPVRIFMEASRLAAPLEPCRSERVVGRPVPSGQNHWSVVEHWPEMADQRGVKQRAQLGAIMSGPLAMPAQSAACCGGQRHGHYVDRRNGIFT